jgi:hypothetical protein
MVFELPLTEQRVKTHQVTALHLLAALASIGAGAVLFRYYDPAALWGVALFIVGLILLLVAVFRNKWLLQKNVNRMVRVFELIIMLSLASFAAIQKWPPPAIMFGVLSAAVLFALLWENQGDGSLKILVDEDGVKLPITSRKRFVAWQDIDQLLLKFGTLTINCSDNRLFQWVIGNTNFDKEQFENFCTAQIEAGRLKRDKNDW